jgi:hypothetical protein
MTIFDQVLAYYRMMFTGIDANDLLLQMRTWENNNVGDISPFHGDVEAALRSIKLSVPYMPSATDLYFPISDARYEAPFIPHCTLLPIPSLQVEVLQLHLSQLGRWPPQLHRSFTRRSTQNSTTTVDATGRAVSQAQMPIRTTSFDDRKP